MADTPTPAPVAPKVELPPSFKALQELAGQVRELAENVTHIGGAVINSEQRLVQLELWRDEMKAKAAQVESMLKGGKIGGFFSKKGK